MRIAGALLLAAIVATSPVARAQTPATSTPAPQAAGTVTLADALARADQNNLEILAARAALPGANFNVDVAAERPNPNLQYDNNKETPRQAITGTLPIELGGKRGYRIDLAKAGVATAQAELDRTITSVRNQVRRAYFDLAASTARVTIATGQRDLFSRARDAAQARALGGDVPRQDVLQAQIELADSENALTAAQGDAAAARAQLNALLGQPAGTALTLADPLESGAVPTLDAAMEQASSANADLVVLDRQIAEQTAKKNLAGALRVPDLSASAAFTYDAQPDFSRGWRVSFAVDIPVFTSHKAGVFVEDAELARLKAERAATLATVSGAVAAAIAHAQAARDQVQRFQTDILPNVGQVEQMAQISYAAGQTNLAALLQALESTREIRQRGLQAGLDYQNALADLERAIGAPIR